MEIFALYPPYLIVLTFLLVILPTVLAIGLRLTLYRHLLDVTGKVVRLLNPEQSSGIIPPIAENLKDRFKTAREKLERVNTAALIDGVYSQETIKFMGFNPRCDRVEYFCRILPSLLVAFGLLGTFAGITLNLWNLSQTVTQADVNNIESLVEELQTPLQGMGLAFITSLVALICSSFLTLTNLRYNTHFVKYQLISYLEDYLDNIYQPEIEGESRLDKAVNRMVDQQHQFLTRFHQNVTDAVESALGKVAQQIADGNQEAANLAKQVYERFHEAAGTIDRSASTFRDTASSLEQQVQKVGQLTVTMNQASTSFQEATNVVGASATLFEKAAQTIERSNFSDKLAIITTNLAKTQEEFTASTILLAEQVPEIIEHNLAAAQTAERVYTQFQASATSLESSATMFQSASETIQQSNFADKLASATTELTAAQEQFSQSTARLEQSTQSIDSAIATLEQSGQAIQQLGSQIADTNQQSAQVLTVTQQRLETEEKAFSQIQGELTGVVERLKSNETTLAAAGDSFLEKTVHNISQFDEVTTKVDSYINNLQKTQKNLVQLVNYLSEKEVKLETSIQHIEKKISQELSTNTKILTSSFDSLGNRIATVLCKDDEHNNNEAQLLAENIKQYLGHLMQYSVKHIEEQVSHEFKTNNEILIKCFNSLENRITKGVFEDQNTENILIAEDIKKYFGHLIGHSVQNIEEKLSKELQENTSKVTTSLESLENKIIRQNIKVELPKK